MFFRPQRFEVCNIRPLGRGTVDDNTFIDTANAFSNLPLLIDPLPVLVPASFFFRFFLFFFPFLFFSFHHQALNHLYCTAIKDGMMVLGMTERYKQKFVTTVYYSTMPG